MILGGLLLSESPVSQWNVVFYQSGVIVARVPVCGLECQCSSCTELRQVNYVTAFVAGDHVEAFLEGTTGASTAARVRPKAPSG